jgi:hypothetical protein
MDQSTTINALGCSYEVRRYPGLAYRIDHWVPRNLCRDQGVPSCRLGASLVHSVLPIFRHPDPFCMLRYKFIEGLDKQFAWILF